MNRSSRGSRARPETPFVLKGVSLYERERRMLDTLISAIYKVYRGSNPDVVLKSALESFEQMMHIRKGRWVRKKSFQIGHGGNGLDIVPSSISLSIRDE